jgi:predicted RNA binding protein YcfA (HicA-like mRNA interferase family)
MGHAAQFVSRWKNRKAGGRALRYNSSSTSQRDAFRAQRSLERRDVNSRKLLQKALSSPANLRFGEVCALARAFGFHLSRVSGSHHIFAHEGVRELVNLQDVGGKAKPYLVRQLLGLVERYNLSLGGEE